VVQLVLEAAVHASYTYLSPFESLLYCMVEVVMLVYRRWEPVALLMCTAKANEHAGHLLTLTLKEPSYR